MQKSFLRPAAAAVAAVAATLLMAGCHDDSANPPATVVTTPAPAVAPGAPAVVTTAPSATGTSVTPDTKINTNAGPGTSNGTDTALADKINTAVVHNKQMTGSRVEPVVTGGVATLNGQVQNQQQKALAYTTARNTPGVVSVKNKLIIVTTGGAKPKPMVVTKIKTKTVVVHDKAAPAMPAGAGGNADTQPPAPPDAPTPSAAPDSGTTTP